MSERPPNIVIVDRGMSNWRSVQSALHRVGALADKSTNPETILLADGLVLPGVGAFPTAMEELARRGLIDALEQFRRRGRPILGICLGMQLFMEASSEHCSEDEFTPGLGWIDGEVNKLWPDKKPGRPHIGWAEVNWAPDATVGHGLADRPTAFYHMHQYVCQPSDEQAIAAYTEQNPVFVSAVEKGNLYGVQFHPEKSSTFGLALLKNFVDLCVDGRAGL